MSLAPVPPIRCIISLTALGADDRVLPVQLHAPILLVIGHDALGTGRQSSTSKQKMQNKSEYYTSDGEGFWLVLAVDRMFIQYLRSRGTPCVHHPSGFMAAARRPIFRVSDTAKPRLRNLDILQLSAAAV